MAEILFRPSGADRWMKCPGSVFLSQNKPNRGGAAATEGSAAHKVVELHLRGERKPEEMVDRIVTLPEGQRITVDADMAEGAELHFAEVAKAAVPGSQVLIEHWMSLQPLDPSDSLLSQNAGTSDTIILDHENGILTIQDYKYGRGILVDADSPQLKNYAVLALVNFPGPWKRIDTVVVQPRAISDEGCVRRVSHTPAEIWDFAFKMYDAMRACVLPDAALNPGKKQCQWCLAKADCPALAEATINIGREAFAKMPLLTANSPMPKMPDKPSLPELGKLSPEDLGTILDRRAMLETWLSAVEQRVVKILSTGGHVPGYKLVRRSGNRRWRDESQVLAALREAGLDDAAIYTKPKLVSPAQAEKKLGNRASVIEPLVERPEGDVTLVCDEDTRRSVTKGLMFTPLPAPE